jgi:hypothetical protein
MDPNAALDMFRKASDRRTRNEAHAALRGWLERGGFEPRWTPEERAAFFRYNPRTGGHR